MKRGSVLQQQVLTGEIRKVMLLVWLASLTLDSLESLDRKYYAIAVGSEDLDGGLER